MPTHNTGNSVVTGISLSPEMLETAQKRAGKLGFRGFSAYIQQLIRNDLNKLKAGLFISRKQQIIFRKKM